MPILQAFSPNRSAVTPPRQPLPPIKPPQSSIISSVLPGSENIPSLSSEIVTKLLKGLPGTDTARRASAYYGSRSGMPSSPYIDRLGFDLYNMKGDQYQQQGLENSLALIAGYTAPALQERGQDISSQEFTQNLGEQARQADQALNLESKRSDWAGRSLYAGGRKQPSSFYGIAGSNRRVQGF